MAADLAVVAVVAVVVGNVAVAGARAVVVEASAIAIATAVDRLGAEAGAERLVKHLASKGSGAERPHRFSHFREMFRPPVLYAVA
jgi:hypothetical protein